MILPGYSAIFHRLRIIGATIFVSAAILASAGICYSLP
jgi:hypothetical protein